MSNQSYLGVRKIILELKPMLHLVDNTELTPVSSKVAKIQPIHNVINTASKQFSIFHILLSVDESMVPYYGQHSRKMSIK